MMKYKKYSFDEFVTDTVFIQWVLQPTEETNRFWATFVKEFPEQKETIKEATTFIRSIRAVEQPVSHERLDLIWQRIEKIDSRKNRRFVFLRWAAILIALLGISILAPRLIDSPEDHFAETEIEEVNGAVVILPDGSVNPVEQKKSEIKVVASGKIVVNKDTLESISNTGSEEKMIKVIMPYGQQANLKLPDGTIVFVNAGSQLSFPEKFDGYKREVYLTGEAFFSVEEDKTHPFIVHTPDISVRVTGTKFNLSAYTDDYFTQTVLVEGAVSVSKKGLFGKKVDIIPGESALFDKESESINTDKVDTDKYTSWIHGYIICINDPVSEVVKKIERYYNCDIEITDDLSGITFSGKLDLKEDIQNVVNSIAFASSLKVETENNKIRIKK